MGAQAVECYGAALGCPPGLRLGAVSSDRAGHPALSLRLLGDALPAAQAGGGGALTPAAPRALLQGVRGLHGAVVSVAEPGLACEQSVGLGLALEPVSPLLALLSWRICCSGNGFCCPKGFCSQRDSSRLLGRHRGFSSRFTLGAAQVLVVSGSVAVEQPSGSMWVPLGEPGLWFSGFHVQELFPSGSLCSWPAWRCHQALGWVLGSHRLLSFPAGLHASGFGKIPYLPLWFPSWVL